MIIWRGYGILVPVLAFACLLLVQLAVDTLLGDGYWKAQQWPLLLAAGMAGALLWPLGRKINSGGVRRVIDAASGIEFSHRTPRHSFFYVPFEWAGLLIAALMVALALFLK